jgi:(p)ppGpp synthase/HD superfamily hydrolase
MKDILDDFQTQTKLVKLAHDIASKAHAGQKRKEGVPYITHPEAVAQIVDTEFYTLMPTSEAARNIWAPMKNYIIMAALLHDTIEDTYVTSELLRQAGFPIMVIEMVQIVTKRPNENYFDFVMRIQESGHVGAKMVKLADLRHNMSDLGEGSMKDKYRLAEHILAFFNK